MKINNREEGFKNIVKVAKRIAITILCCVPIMGVFSYFTRNIIKSDALQITCFVIIMGIAVAVVEVIARAKEKAKAEEVETKKDVFK